MIRLLCILALLCTGSSTATWASEKELREFVLGYGSVLFNSETALELERER